MLRFVSCILVSAAFANGKLAISYILLDLQQVRFCSSIEYDVIKCKPLSRKLNWHVRVFPRNYNCWLWPMFSVKLHRIFLVRP